MVVLAALPVGSLAVGRAEAAGASSDSSSVTAGPANGQSWSIQATPNPPGSTLSQLFAVSCLSPVACTAVGDQDNGSDETPLVERWNGQSWSILATPPGVDSGGLLGVSCASKSFCAAVGGHGNAPLAEIWNGRNWSLDPMPSPPGATDGGIYYPPVAGLHGLSCVSAHACLAVGTYEQSAGPPTPAGAFAEQWNGTRWTMNAFPYSDPMNEIGTPSAISCVSLHACIALRGGGVEMWNGRYWTSQHIPLLKSWYSSRLNAVSCASGNACTAVGSYSLPVAGYGGPAQALVERWNGVRWKIQRTPHPGVVGSLVGVSCVSARSCTAISATSAEQWNGRSWTLQTTQAAAGAENLAAVSCVSVRTCTAVGSSTIAEASAQTLAEGRS
jgi:hypothetical protein